jgi:DNA-binding NarL/FixJ family response regulator
MEPSSLTPRVRDISNRFAGVDGEHRDRPPAASSKPAIRVLLAHGEGLVRAGLRALLEQQPDINVTDEAADGDEVVELARRTRPDLVLMDRRLHGLDCLEATRRILAEPAPASMKVLILDSSESDDELLATLRAGASGFLAGDTDPAELVQALRAVAAGEALLSPRVTRRLVEAFAAQPDPHRPVPEPFDELTAREREVMTLVAMGLTNAEVAERLVVTRATAKTHVNRAMMKLHARDRAKLVALAYQAGFVEPGRHLAKIEHGAAASGAPAPGTAVLSVRTA